MNEVQKLTRSAKRKEGGANLSSISYQLSSALSSISCHLSSERKRAAFTLLEVLVASVLMGMLVTILTMIFNQSAIAWRTGKAGVANMTEAERQLSRLHALADNVLPIAGNRYCVVSPWDDSSDTIRPRGVQDAGALGLGLPTGIDPVNRNDWRQTLRDASSAKSVKAYIVGVRSWGPDRIRDTEDDISTWPEKE